MAQWRKRAGEHPRRSGLRLSLAISLKGFMSAAIISTALPWLIESKMVSSGCEAPLGVAKSLRSALVGVLTAVTCEERLSCLLIWGAQVERSR